MTDYLIYIPLIIIGFSLGIFYGKEKIMDAVRELGIGRTEDKAYYEFFTKTFTESKRLQSRFITILIASIVGLILVLMYDPYRGAIVFPEDMPEFATRTPYTLLCNARGVDQFAIEVYEQDKKANFGGADLGTLKWSGKIPYNDSGGAITFKVARGNIYLDLNNQSGKLMTSGITFNFYCDRSIDFALSDPIDIRDEMKKD